MKFWEFAKSTINAQAAELWLYGVIGDSDWADVSARQFASDLSALGDVAEITVRINSNGGDVFASTAIYNLLVQHPARKIVRIDGIAASGASVIAMAGDEVIMPSNTNMMIHGPSVDLHGNEEDLANVIKLLQSISSQMQDAYMTKCKLPRNELIEMMKKDTWLTAQEALEYGFADKIIDPVKVAACAKPGIFNINGLEVDANALSLKINSSSTSISAPKPERNEEDKHMKAWEFLSKLRSFFSIDKNPAVSDALNAIQQETPADAPAEAVLDRVGGVIHTAFNEATEFIASLREVGIDTVDKAKELTARAKLGDQYRTDLVTAALAEGVRAQGENFDKERWTRTFASATIDDIKAYHADFEKAAIARLGAGGRQINSADPNNPVDGVTAGIEFDKLPAEKQAEQIRAFQERTGGALKK